MAKKVNGYFYKFKNMGKLSDTSRNSKNVGNLKKTTLRTIVKKCGDQISTNSNQWNEVDFKKSGNQLKCVGKYFSTHVKK